ncbi:MAG: hydrogenase iron-sulfur subunit [bacterium]
MAGNTGVYICTGCDIGAAVDVEGLRKVAENEYKVPVCRTHPFLCGDEGVALLKEDAKTGGVERFVLAACSPRYHQATFDLGSEVMMVRAPLREYVAWTQPHGEKDTQALAEDIIRMHAAAVAKHQLAAPLEPPAEKTLLVIGGGTTGMTAALESARAGYPVKLVEKEAELGGFARRLHLSIPAEAPFRDPQPVPLRQSVEQVEGHANITVYKSARVASISGQPGAFGVKLSQGGATLDFTVGAIVLATGGQPYDAGKLGHLGSGYDHVVTSVEFEEMAGADTIVRKDGKAVTSIAFIQCAGSRDAEHLPYCSSFCCTTTLKQAGYLRSREAESKAYIFYRDMMTPGQYENFYKEQQADPGIFLTKGDVVGVREDADKNILVEVDNTLLAEKIQVTVDLVVLAVGIVPSTEDDPILNLEYRQGPALPDQKYGFPDSHFICFPYETRRTGIYAAGTVRQPMDMNFARTDAGGAAMKAIQSVELAGSGQAVHPRAGDGTYPVFRLDGCTQCKRCTEECPFGVLDEDDKGTPFLNIARCRRCGVCMGACPVQIISFQNYSVDIVGEMIKNVEIPDEFEEKPRILVFACENDALPVFDMMALNRLRVSPYIRVIPLRCLGGTNLIWITDALSVGFDGVMFLGCRFGDDYQCHFINGSELANTRLSKVQETIGRLNLESERVQQFEVTMNDYARLPAMIEKFVEQIEGFGPNPFKGL